MILRIVWHVSFHSQAKAVENHAKFWQQIGEAFLEISQVEVLDSWDGGECAVNRARIAMELLAL